MARNNKAESEGHPARGTEARPAAADRRGIQLVIRQRRQTPQEERRCNAAIDALLSELVRQEMGREGSTHG